METKLKAIWPRELYCEKNVGCLFVYRTKTVGRSVRLYLSAEHAYRVHINGQFAGAGPSRCAHGRGHVDEYVIPTDSGNPDLTVAVEVMAYNVEVITDAAETPFFAAQILDADGVEVCNSHDFMAYRLEDVEQTVPRYSWQRYFLECYRMRHDRRRFYRGEVDGLKRLSCHSVPCTELTPRNVPYPRYEIKKAKRVKEGSVGFDPDAPLYNNRFLDERVGKNGFSREAISDSLVDEVCRLRWLRGEPSDLTPRYELYDLSVNRSGFIGIKFKVETTSRIILIWDEILNKSGEVDPLRMNMANMLRLDVAAGEYDFESFQPYTARYVCVAVMSGDAEIEELYVRTYEHPNARRLEFAIDNAGYTELMLAARRTLEQNAVDILTDCPSRERVGWLCDSYFIGAAETLFTGENRVERHFLENYVHAPQADYIPDGMIPMSYPGYSSSKNYIPNWALWYILELRSYLHRTGDRELIRQSRKKVLGVLSFFKRFQNDEELLENVPGWTFVEWSRANDYTSGVNFPSNMLYCAALRAAGQMYGIPAYGALADRIEQKVIGYSLGDSLFFRDHAIRVDGELKVVEEDISETCQYYAFFFGIADATRNPELLERLITEFGSDRDEQVCYPNVAKSNAFIGNLLRLAYLSENGYARFALRQVEEYYLHMAKRTGTLWEFASDYKSCNHGFASYIAEIILRGLIGYDGCEGKTVTFLPDFGDVNCRIVLPLSETARATVTVKDGVRKIDLPRGYYVSMIHKKVQGTKK